MDENVILTEEIPGVEEIGNLLDMLAYDDIDVGSDTDNVKLGYNKEDLVDIDELHVSIPTKEVTKILGISSQISSGGEFSFEGKVITIKIDKGGAKFLLSDNKRYIEREVDILNKEKRFTGFLAFNASIINRLVKVCASVFTIIERDIDGDLKYYLKIPGGEIAIDNIKMDENKFIRDFVCKNGTEYDTECIIDSVKRLYTLASSSIKFGRSIDFLGKTVQASPINCLAKIDTKDSFTDFKLPLTDVKILSGLCSMDSSNRVTISKAGNVFIGDRFKFKTESFPASPSSTDSVAERMFDFSGVSVDATHFSQIIDLAYGLDSSTGKVRLNYTNGKVSCEIVSKRDSSKVIIKGDKNNTIEPLEYDVEVSAISIKGALSVFSGIKEIDIKISPDGVALVSGDVRVAILGVYLNK